jgi:hypothetical protein
VNHELKRIRKNAVITKYKVLHRRLVEGVVENQKTAIDIAFPARDLKPGPPQYETVLHTNVYMSFTEIKLSNFVI